MYVITSLVAGFVPYLDNSIDPAATNLSLVQVASLLLGTILPIAVALVTKKSWSGQTKAFILAALSALSGFLTEYINSDNFVWQQALLTTVMTFIVAVATYFGLWSRPNGEGNSIAGNLQDKLVHD